MVNSENIGVYREGLNGQTIVLSTRANTMQTVTLKTLEAVVTRINIITSSPLESYSKVNERYIAQIGNYHLSRAYGGFALHRMCNLGGGVSDVFQCGHVPKRELLDRMYAFINGYNAATDAATDNV